MKFNFFILSGLLLIYGGLCHASAKKEKPIEIKESVINQSIVLDKAVDFHLTNRVMPLKNSTISLISEDAWLFFDNMQPAEVIKKYSSSILIKGAPLKINVNSRIAIYKQGAVVIPQSAHFQPLEVFTGQNYSGNEMKLSLYHYYTNKPAKGIPGNMVEPLEVDNSIRSFKLKRGYMATFATSSNGMGYSRVFIADTADILVPVMPAELDKKVSFIRVFQWQWPSKKGWCGGRGYTVASNGLNKQNNEIALTHSTWFYSWGAGDPLNINSEFVPMKWGHGGSLDKIYSRKKVTHLLGYNEPNRPDQSNMSVGQAIAEWPQLMKSGLRLGSPAVSDNSHLDWLYHFLSECEKRNYRVDFVTVHAYWGFQQMHTPEDWYRKLREIHIKTGRPIWLTEWNIGANWTKEKWPKDKKEQFAKQLRDLKKVLEVLDTASFIERYSIYNWVEDKRAMVLDSFSYKTEKGKKVRDRLLKQKLTPAGEFYRINQPGFAFNSTNQFVPKWHYSDVPRLSFHFSGRDKIDLKWKNNSNSEMISQFVIEKSEGSKPYRVIGQITPEKGINRYSEILKDPPTEFLPVHYQIGTIGLHGDTVLTSNSVSYQYLQNMNDGISIGHIVNPTFWSLYFFKEPYEKAPLFIFGTPTNNNKVPQTYRARIFNRTAFEFRFDTWEYLNDPVFDHEDTIAYMAFPRTGFYKLKGVSAYVGKISNVTHGWIEIKFAHPFQKIPVVFTSQVSSSCDSTTAVRIKEVTRQGFKIHLQYEAAITPPRIGEDVNYLAITPGSGRIDGKKIQVGRATEPVGNFFQSIKINFNSRYINPAFFGAMQTENDEVSADLRIKSLGGDHAEVFKEQEVSKGARPMSKEIVGWMVTEDVKDL